MSSTFPGAAAGLRGHTLRTAEFWGRYSRARVSPVHLG